MLASLFAARVVQEPTGEPPPEPAAAADFDMVGYVLDSDRLNTPFGYLNLPDPGSWMLAGIDLTPTKYVVFIWIIAALMLLIFIPAGRAAKRRQTGETGGKGPGAVEALVLFFRDKVVMPNVGHGGENFVPFVTTLFFFILIGNLLGLVPYGAAATASISVTGALALMSLVVIEGAGMKALGPKGYMGTIVYIPPGLPKWLVPIMALIMTPVELLGKIAKPFALAIRLMANMVAGAIVILAIIGLIFTFGSYWFAVGPVVMTVALTFLKIFVAFLQAYVFALLTSVFIGLIRAH